MKTFRFLEFPVYKASKKFYLYIRSFDSRLYKEKALQDQLNRSALSVILNIAEGSAKKSDKEFAKFLETSAASMNEVVACLDIMQINGLLTSDEFSQAKEESNIIVKQLVVFLKS